MTFALPNTSYEFLIISVPLLTLLLGLAFLIMPRKLLHYMGLEAKSGQPHTIGEGRSSFAGFLIAVPLGCLLLQEPLVQQPGLSFMLAVAWLLSAAGRFLQILFDNARRKRIFVRMVLAFALGGIAWATAEPVSFEFIQPRNNWDWFLFAVAILTAGLGLIAFCLPKLALAILKLQTRANMPFAVGETRGSLAGFMLAVGGTYLFVPQASLFVGLVMGAGWLITAIGRLASIIFDRGSTLYNWLGFVFEAGVGSLVMAVILGFIR